MSIALVIPSADFSVNAMERIIVSEPIPCTGISLNRSTAEITAIGSTITLTATVTPSDTTDRIVWSSSDTDVVTVDSGVVTSVGVGIATITATCGGFSASCEVASKAYMSDATRLNNVFLSGDSAISGGNGLPTIQQNNYRGALLSSSGTLRFYNVALGVYYPYVLPKGTKRIKISRTTPTTLSIDNIQFFNANTASESDSATCMLIGNITNKASDTSASLVVDIPTYDEFAEIDAIAINFKISSGAWDESYFNNVTVEFLPAE